MSPHTLAWKFDCQGVRLIVAKNAFIPGASETAEVEDVWGQEGWQKFSAKIAEHQWNIMEFSIGTIEYIDE